MVSEMVAVTPCFNYEGWYWKKYLEAKVGNNNVRRLRQSREIWINWHNYRCIHDIYYGVSLVILKCCDFFYSLVSDEKFIKELKGLKDKINQTKEQNKQAVEKLKNTNLTERKKIITAIVNLELIDKMYQDKVIFDLRDGELNFYADGQRLSISDVIILLREKLDTFAKV